jgi:sulfatase maturation enzyme AslB (radical SAM superfamily)
MLSRITSFKFNGVLMVIHKITYSKAFKRVNLHNYGCNFNCDWCLYKLEGRTRPNKFLQISQIKKILGELDIERAHFVGGEVTTYPLLREITDFTEMNWEYTLRLAIPMVLTYLLRVLTPFP